MKSSPNRGGKKSRRPVLLLLLTAAVAACGPSEKNAPLPPSDLQKREQVLREVKTQLGALENGDPALVQKLLGHRDYRVRRAAALKCMEMENPPEALIERLAAAVEDPRREVRIAAMRGLSGVESDKAVDATIRALADGDAKVRIWAYKGLKKLEKRAVPAMIDHVMAHTETAKVKYRTATNQTETLSDVLLRSLSEMGKSAVPYLVDILQKDQGELTAKAVTVLGNIGPSAGDSVPVLLRLLESTSDTSLKKNTIEAIGQIGDMDPEVMPKLLELSEDNDATISGAAKQALRKLDNET